MTTYPRTTRLTVLEQHQCALCFRVETDIHEQPEDEAAREWLQDQADQQSWWPPASWPAVWLGADKLNLRAICPACYRAREAEKAETQGVVG